MLTGRMTGASVRVGRDPGRVGRDTGRGVGRGRDPGGDVVAFDRACVRNLFQFFLSVTSYS